MHAVLSSPLNAMPDPAGMPWFAWPSPSAGRELDPSRILGPQRHGEWFQQQSGQGAARLGGSRTG